MKKVCGLLMEEFIQPAVAMNLTECEYALLRVLCFFTAGKDTFQINGWSIRLLFSRGKTQPTGERHCEKIPQLLPQRSSLPPSIRKSFEWSDGCHPGFGTSFTSPNFGDRKPFSKRWILFYDFVQCCQHAGKINLWSLCTKIALKHAKYFFNVLKNM